MANLLDPVSENGKILLVGESGAGKTGAKAALVAAGYKLRMIDTDKGFKILRSLLTDTRYPYADYMKKHGIDPNKNVNYIPIDVPMDIDTTNVKGVSWNIVAPKSSAAWNRVLNLVFREWKDDNQSFGNIMDWDSDVVLDFDTMSTLATISHFFVQDLNGRLGSLVDDHGRDTGGAQELLRRLLMKLSSVNLVCNVIMTTHITRVDTSTGAIQSPEARLREHLPIDAKGYPAAIGRALSPQIPKFFNDCFIVRAANSAGSIKREISSIPIDNTSAKNSVYLEDSYPVSTGLAEIFAALRYQDPPTELIEAIRGTNGTSSPKSPSGFGTFGKK